MIDGKRKFLIFNYTDDLDNYIDIGTKEGYNLIIICSEEDPKIEEKIWESIRENKAITYIGEKEIEKSVHTCQILTVLQEEKDDTGSIIKRSSKTIPNQC